MTNVDTTVWQVPPSLTGSEWWAGLKRKFLPVGARARSDHAAAAFEDDRDDEMQLFTEARIFENQDRILEFSMDLPEGSALRISRNFAGVEAQTATGAHLSKIQARVSGFSRYLPEGFASRINRDFAEMLAEDAWEEGDALPSIAALDGLLAMLRRVAPARAPGIGSDDRGSVTAYWFNDGNRLTLDFLDEENVRWVLTRVGETGEVERAAGKCQVDRLGEVLAPYAPEVWFDPRG